MEKIEEIKNWQAERILLRAANLPAPTSSEGFSKKSSEIKRVQKFINKLKQNDVKTRETLLSELDGLNLSKFIIEISQIISETSIQQKDLLFYMKFSSLLHQSYEEFSPNFFTNLTKQIKTCGTVTDEAAKGNKRRNLFRFLCELFLIGFPFQFSKIFLLLQEIIIYQDKNIFNMNISTASTFASNYHYEFFDVPHKTPVNPDPNPNPSPDIEFFSELIKPEGKKALMDFYKKYAEMLKDNLKYTYQKLLDQETKNNQIIIEKGLIDPENEAKYKELKSLYQKTLENIGLISDSLNLPISTSLSDETTRLNSEIKPEVVEEVKVMERKEEEIFNNDDEKYFYTELIDLKDYVPEVLLVSKKAQKTETEESGEIQIKVTQGNQTYIDISMNYDQFLNKLNQCISKDVADDLAKDFCYLNSKKNRNKLILDVVEYRYEHALMTPFLCRFIANLSRYFKDIGEALIQKLLEDFTYLKENTKDSFKDFERRVRNMKFFCELTKFKVCSTLTMLNCLKEYIDDFTGHNIDMVILILETCGSYLLRNKESSFRFNHMLDKINKIRKSKMMSPSIDMQIENAIMAVKPSSKIAKKNKKVLSDLEEYIKHLLFERLNMKDAVFVSTQILTLPISECEDILIKYILKLGTKGRFDNIECLAYLLAFLKPSYPTTIIKITDFLIDQIICGLELNNFNERQKRTTIIKFFGELFCYQIIESELIFEILYKILEFGHDNEKTIELIDSPDDNFRVTLVCTLLDSVKEYFRKRKLKIKVERFLMFFQKYILSKTYLPMLSEFMVLDLIEYLSPGIKIYKNLKDVTEACANFELEDSKIGDQEQKSAKKQDKCDRIEEEKMLMEEEKKRSEEVRINKAKNLDIDFDKEFQQMISESINESKNPNGSQIKINVILNPKKKIKSEEEKKKDTISLIFRQGNKSFAKEIKLSNNEKIVSVIQKRKDIELNEKNFSKNITAELHKQSLETAAKEYNYSDMFENTQIFIKQIKKK